MNKFAGVLTYAFLAIAAGVPADAADALPAWAYPVNPPGISPVPDDGALKRVPNSAAAYTLTQIRDLFSPPRISRNRWRTSKAVRERVRNRRACRSI